MSCTHDVTLVLSTRVFVDAPFVEIPEESSFSRSPDGQVYVDFYKVIVHNERYSNEEWKRNFSQLMLAFKGYEQEIKDYVFRNLPGVIDPKHVSIRLSTAREANILEGLNLALSGYECYNVDRSFDRTGNACIVISPGFGVFDTNCDMVSFTKQRVLDLGTMVHLVCLGPQPLHAVPLFVCRDFENPDNPEVYIVPHWMNHSFFRSSREIYALKNSETVIRINVSFLSWLISPYSKKHQDPYPCNHWKNLGKEGEGEQDHNILRSNFEPARSPRERQHQRSKTITSLVSTTTPESCRQRTISLNEELLLISRPMEDGLSTSEIGSFDSTFSTHGAANGAFRRKQSKLVDNLIHMKPQDLTQSYQSGSSYQPRDLNRLWKKTTVPADFFIGASASSWQPMGEREMGRRQSNSVFAKKGSQNPVWLKSMEAAAEGAFRTFPFGIHPLLFGVHKTSSQRRWGHFHTAVDTCEDAFPAISFIVYVCCIPGPPVVVGISVAILSQHFC
ncbi:unnamed protein product [Hydatigera taeniaeformis]|uniref:DEP domain-containing protein n=1 Tax=Hydatigena taeniaeformis TaxID=6205 RepID=A0A0R3WJM1_HYDTA|nr:unnamed protein product [Hydatigera taeniaeformis]